MKKYKLHLNENQVNQVLTALDFYSRISIGQLNFLKEFISDSASDETLAKLQKEMFPDLTGLNHSYGIAGKQTPEEAKIGYDIYKKIMFVFNPVGVYADKPYALSKEGLPDFIQIKSGETNRKKRNFYKKDKQGYYYIPEVSKPK